MRYARLTIKGEKRNRIFWAIIESKNKDFTLCLPVNKEGEDKSYYRKDGTLIIVKELIANGLIVKELPAVMNKTYCELELSNGI